MGPRTAQATPTQPPPIPPTDADGRGAPDMPGAPDRAQESIHLLRPRGLRWWLLGGVVVLLGTWVFAVTIGSAGTIASDLPALRPTDVLASVWHHLRTLAASIGLGADPGQAPISAIREVIIWQGRAPRILVASAVGAGLALAGAVMQSVVRNPLADPYLLGLSSGASLGAVAVLVLGMSIALPVAAFAGAMVALALTLTLAGRAGTASPGRMILAGVAVAQGASALVSFTIFSTVRGDSYREILTWLLGSVGGATWSSVLIAGGALVIVGPLILGAARTLDSFAFGDVTAASLGVNVNSSRWLLLTATALLTGAMVSVSGAIGFVGLVFPHVVRLLVGTSHRLVLPLAALGGAIFLTWADTLARTVFAPQELPVGIVTAAVGAPVFAWLLRRGRREA